VMQAMRVVPRHEFVATEVKHLAYRDCPLPIGDHQTISQPYMVALMTEMLGLKGYERVLEVGTGSGYQTAILCQLAAQVYSLERYPRLAGRAAQVLAQLGYENVEIHVGDGSQGLADMAPFDAIIVSAGTPRIPDSLKAQLAIGGRLVIPVGLADEQKLVRLTRTGPSCFAQDDLAAVRFVKLSGAGGWEQGGMDL